MDFLCLCYEDVVGGIRHGVWAMQENFLWHSPNSEMEVTNVASTDDIKVSTKMCRKSL